MKVRLEGGHEAKACAIDGNALTLLSPQAFAPGSPIGFVVLLGEEEHRFEGRTIGSKRLDDAVFEVRLRFVNLRRRDRELLAQQLG